MDSPAVPENAWLASLLAPAPRPLTHREFALTAVLPDGPQAGERYNPDSEPAQSVIVDALDGRILDCSGQPFREITHCAATQTGKSLTDVVLPAFRAITSDNSVVYCLPTGDLIGKIWLTKLLPTIRGCGLGPWLPDKGPGSRGGKPVALPMHHPGTMRLAGSMIFIAGGEGDKREAGQASVTAGVVLIDEADEYESAHRVSLVQQRAASFGRNALIVRASTVKKDSGSVILALLEDSTNSRLWFACPFCKRYQPIAWENVRYDDADDIAAFDSARYFCPHCAAGWTEADRRLALRTYKLVHGGQTIEEAGEILGPMPRTRSFGLLTPKLDFHLGYGLGDLAVEHRKAKAHLEVAGDHGLLRSFYRDRLCRPYTAELEEFEAGKELTWSYLFNRSHRCAWGPTRAITDREAERQPTYSRHVADPSPDCLGTVAGIDVQHDRIYWTLVGYAADGTTYDQAWGYEYAREDRTPPALAELHALLDRTDALLREYSGTLPFQAGGIDVGDQTDALMAWVKGRRQVWKPTKGASGSMKDEPGDIPGLLHVRDGLYLIATDAAREMIHAAYRRPSGEKGACHIPSGLQSSASDTAYLRHICAEKQILDVKTKKFKVVRGPGRWDWQDARRIAEVMVRLQLRPRRKGPSRSYGAVGAVKAF